MHGFCKLPAWSVALMAGTAALAGCASHNNDPVPLATAPTVGQEVGAVANNKVEITFPEGGYALSAEANRQLDLASRLYRDVHPVMMFTVGYTDGRGAEFSNLLLSAQRARAVKNGLVARGIPADRVLIQALGTSDPANSGDPLAPENRRAVIRWRVL